MPWIIADDEGRICEARKKIYNTEKGAKMGYRAALDHYLQMWYLYDDDLNYHYYVQKSGGLVGRLLTAAHPVEFTDEKERRFNELTEQFKSMYSIQEMEMIRGKK
jgi:hypothetical protein